MDDYVLVEAKESEDHGQLLAHLLLLLAVVACRVATPIIDTILSTEYIGYLVRELASVGANELLQALVRLASF